MARRLRLRTFVLWMGLCLVAVAVTACNLSSGEQTEQIDLTTAPTSSAQATRTRAGTLTITVPTTLPLPSSIVPTQPRPTSVVVLPPTSIVVLPPTNTPLPVNIAILSPVPGNVVSGNVQVVGAAAHPQFLQYQLEYGPDPNLGNLWYPVTSGVQTPVFNGLLGIWNTTAVQDATYQLRVRVYLRDGSTLTTVVNNIRVQNRQPTPQPTATQNVPRPIAAFTQNVTTGQVPLSVQFTNQSSGSITRVFWNFGDGGTSSENNPVHVFNSPGLYSVTLTVEGPGGTSNVSRQISAQSANPPVAGFTSNVTTGIAPLTVQFTDQSAGTVTAWAWNFSDGTGSTERNPSHVFVTPGVYNVLLTVTGPSGSSFATRQIVVQGPTPTFTPTWTATPITPTLTSVPPTSTFTPTVTPTGTFTLPPTNTNIPPTETFTSVPPTATFTSVPPTSTFTSVPPTATFTSVPPTETFTSVPPTATFTSIPPTETFTSVPPTATFTSIPPTATFTLAPTNTDLPTATPTATLTETPTATATNTSIPVQVGFTAQQQNGTLTVNFTNTSTGAVSTLWNFGDGVGTSSEVNPVYTYSQGGTYTVTLTITDAANQQQAAQVQVNVVQAAFTAQANGATVTVTNASLGNPVAYSWDFGDGVGTSSETNPAPYTYAQSGQYTIRLTVTAADGVTTHTAEQIVDVQAQPQPIDPGQAGTTTVQPNIGALAGALQPLYSNGASQGRQAFSFAFAGDSTFGQSGILDAFAPGTPTDLSGSPDLQAIIDWYNNAAGSSFERGSFAVNNGWRAADLLNPGLAAPECGGATPIQCEIQQSNASVILIAVGYNDALAGTDITAFSDALNSIIQTATTNNVIPVLFTLRPSTDGGAVEQATTAINDAIISAASANNVPLVNLWGALDPLADNGIAGDGSFTTSPGGAGDLSAGALSTYGTSVVNQAVLRVLNDLRSQIFPDAAPPSP
ncbi:MAG: PKD domain-containing protein [bacterium]|nr:PKD domain-containing protein [bacterium]